ncbi:HEAT repeat domain-containing protein [Gordonia sp. NB41Y]|uniref:HEAT repeat domain-containing protein n=1 Tax=Gordonia sp. NB41Y TaxID=875808 RepID=UPI0032AF0318
MIPIDPMTDPSTGPTSARIASALSADNPSTRLSAALAAGTDPDPSLIGVLVERSGVEPDFFVRDMLVWALTRQPVDLTVPHLAEAVRSASPQMRSQALHTLSKIGAPSTWGLITAELLHDPDDDVARSAWRAAVVLVPDDRRLWLADELSTERGRGGREVRKSLRRAQLALSAQFR